MPHPTETRGFSGDPRFGRLRLNEWTTPDGERRSRTQVVADTAEFLDPPKKAGDPDGGVAEPAALRRPRSGNGSAWLLH